MTRGKVTIEQAILQNVPKGARVLLAVSGGQDSIVMLNACLEYQARLGLDIIVAHVDHSLRESSHRDAELVEKIAKKHQLKFLLSKLDSSNQTNNFEAWARNKRYEFFAECLKKHELHYIMTAHTANDVAETLLMRLIANKELGSIAKLDNKRKLIRPLLDITRLQIEEYIKTNGLEHIEDETNLETQFLRNKIRIELIPFLKENFDQRIEEVLCHQSQNLSQDIELLRNLAKNELKKIGSFKESCATWFKELRELCAENQLAEFIVGELFLPELGYRMSRDKRKEVVNIILCEQLATELPGGYRLERRDKSLYLLKN